MSRSMSLVATYCTHTPAALSLWAVLVSNPAPILCAHHCYCAIVEETIYLPQLCNSSDWHGGLGLDARLGLWQVHVSSVSLNLPCRQCIDECHISSTHLSARHERVLHLSARHECVLHIVPVMSVCCISVPVMSVCCIQCPS